MRREYTVIISYKSPDRSVLLNPGSVLRETAWSMLLLLLLGYHKSSLKEHIPWKLDQKGWGSLQKKM